MPRSNGNDRVATAKGAPLLPAGQAAMARSVVERTLYFMKTNAARYPWLALPLSKLRGEGELLGESTDILIESFPRCGSSFAVAAFRMAQEPRDGARGLSDTYAGSCDRRHAPSRSVVGADPGADRGSSSPTSFDIPSEG